MKIVLVLVLTLLLALDYTCGITIQTRLGIIQGTESNLPEGKIFVFKKIPFARPPVGNLRFRKPEPYGIWNSSLDAREFGPICYQPQTMLPMSEDCLHLNVYVPREISLVTKKAVMVWVHGGAYILGSARLYDGTPIAMLGDVIVVTINYRLGPFGFFSTGDDASPGNYGLWDQHMAFRWVHDNIADYGGDPTSVTIFGESAGGGSVSFQSLYPGNKHLFHRVIAQSGVAISVFFRADERIVQSEAQKSLQRLNCSLSTSSMSFNCLQQLPASEFLPEFFALRTNFPVIDNDFVIGYAEKVLEDENSEVFKFFTSLDYMTGSLDGDGHIVIDALLTSDVSSHYNVNATVGYSYQILCDYYVPILIDLLSRNGSSQSIKNKVCSMYKNESSIVAQSNLLVDLYSDAVYTFPSLLTADFHYLRSKGNKSTYVYLMTRVSPLQPSIFPDWTYGWMDRATHAMDTVYMFNSKQVFSNTEDLNFTEMLLKYMTNFAKTGNPNGNNLVFWPEYDYQKKVQTLDLSVQTASNIFPERSKFWMETIYKDTSIVQTQLGPLLGNTRYIPGAGNIYEFLNIPFAKPPIGQFRFRKSEPYGAWQGTLNATSYGPSCMQSKLGLSPTLPNQDISEDCLQLNIYVPYNVSSNGRRSVMIWVHGGGYAGGQASLYDGTSLALRGNVIVVTINYRLGAFGFFSTNDSASPGNYGLWDQHLAFKWVHDNIVAFGGNSGSVTIFGESAGGGSVSFQMLYPGNVGLFQKVISQSGVAFSSILRTNQSTVRHIADSYIAYHSCSSSNTSVSVDCLRAVSADALLEGGQFAPTIDGEFVIGYAEDVLQNKNSDIYSFYTSVDYMSGTLDGDGAIVMVYLITEALLNSRNLSMVTGMTTDFLCGYISNYLSETLYGYNGQVKIGICDHYSNRSSIAAQSNAIVDLYTDLGFTMPAISSSDFRLSGMNSKSTYMFLMTRVNPRQQALFPYWTFPWTNRAVHGVDVYYIFSPEELLVSFNQTEDIQLGHKMQQYWSNFAKTSDPNGPNLPFWPRYDYNRKIQILDVQIETETDVFSERRKFWMNSALNDKVLLQTQLGTILGRKRSVSGLGPIFEYLNIPYAKAPIGNLRFRKPEPYGAWQSTLNATEYGPSCMQPIFLMDPTLPNQNMSEDCLQLNIHVPYDVSPTNKRSVMIWVHGGGFTAGQASYYDGSSLALRGNVIVVTINYRLGALGFFYTGNSASLGNYGLWDQHLAFKWIHDNIASFGGDPDSVTIFGESAGGISVSYHSLYPGNEGLFQRVIPMSGSAFISRSSNESLVRQTTIDFLSKLNCYNVNFSSSIECLRNLSAESLVGDAVYMPTIDGEFVMGYAEDVLKNTKSEIYRFYTSLDYMVGSLDGDGVVALSFFISPSVLQIYNLSLENGLSTEFLCDYLTKFFTTTYFRSNNQIASGMCNLFRNESSLSVQSNAILDLFTDVIFTIPALNSADLHIKQGSSKKTYMYVMTHVNPKQGTIYPGMTYPWTHRAAHAMDLPYLFNPELFVSVHNQSEDMELGYKVQKYLANFAKTSDPNSPDLPYWPQYDSRRHTQILDIPITTETDLFPRRLEFWLKTVPSILQGNGDSHNNGIVRSGSGYVTLSLPVKAVCFLLLCCRQLLV